MNTVPDFEDMLALLNHHSVKYLIVGGLAFIYHAKPRFTKDMDLWIEGSRGNIASANHALVEFGSPTLLAYDEPDQVVQMGLAPNRIDLLVEMGPVSFDEAWHRRLDSPYGDVVAHWIDLDSLVAIKSSIDDPRHQEDARVLRKVKDRLSS
ncbi:MAG: hypothetical protein RRC34_09585 [Lentisphaeria bacterium]|nr:hypothetical protein [Lentisphaeria bacterium]